MCIIWGDLCPPTIWEGIPCHSLTTLLYVLWFERGPTTTRQQCSHFFHDASAIGSSSSRFVWVCLLLRDALHKKMSSSWFPFKATKKTSRPSGFQALSFDTCFAPAWVAYGHAFAQHDESDQALAAQPGETPPQCPKYPIWALIFCRAPQFPALKGK